MSEHDIRKTAVELAMELTKYKSGSTTDIVDQAAIIADFIIRGKVPIKVKSDTSIPAKLNDGFPNHDVRKRPEDFESCMRYVLKELEAENVDQNKIETLCNALRNALGVSQVIKPNVGVMVKLCDTEMVRERI